MDSVEAGSKNQGLSAASVLREGKATKSKLVEFLTKPGIGELIATVALIVLGIIVGCAAEGLDFVDALYLTVQYITTIGYGDIVPSNNGSRMFLAFYCIGCLVLMAHYMGSSVSNVQDKMVAEATTALSSGSIGKSCMNSPAKKSLFITSVLWLAMILFGMIFYGAVEGCSCSFGVSAVNGCDDSDYDKCVSTGGVTKDYVQTFYMSVITLTTIGLGDYVPESRVGRWIGIFWMLIGTAISAAWVGSLTSFFFDRDQTSKKKEVAPRTKDLFASMDGDSDGYLQKAEHHLYLLTLNGVLTGEMLQKLEEDYAKLSAGQAGVSYEQLAPNDSGASS